MKKQDFFRIGWLFLLLLICLSSPCWSQDQPAEANRDNVIEGRETNSSGQDLISVEFINADIKSVLMFLADIGGFNLVINGDVKGNITVKLKDVTWQSAMETILAEYDLVMVSMGRVYSITTRENYLERK